LASIVVAARLASRVFSESRRNDAEKTSNRIGSRDGRSITAVLDADVGRKRALAAAGVERSAGGG
jgi:hypothetical protein